MSQNVCNILLQWILGGLTYKVVECLFVLCNRLLLLIILPGIPAIPGCRYSKILTEFR